VKRATANDERWIEVLRLIDETFTAYTTGMATLRERVIVDLRRRLTESKVLAHPLLEQSGPRERPASTARHPRARRRRPHG
jgi:hypothetical protein